MHQSAIVDADGKSAEGSPPGLDIEGLFAFLNRDHPNLFAGLPRANLIAGGRSNLTYELTDDHHRVVLRRPPLGHVLESAHDMGREFRVMAALAGSAVPVPRMLGLCTDSGVLGAPFYLMSYVDGTVYRWRADLEAIGPDRARTVGLAAIDTLATLHRVDPREIGLSDLGRPDGFVERQVSRWGRQLESSRSRPLPGIDDLLKSLANRVPTSSAIAVVHGDFRLDNLLLSDEDEVVAVVDWEMATIGDPLTDVGVLLAYNALARASGGEGIADASMAPGHPSPGQMLDTYSARTGLDVHEMGFYLGLGLFKVAVILEGIFLRHSQGNTVGDGFERAGGLVYAAIDAGLEAVKEQF